MFGSCSPAMSRKRQQAHLTASAEAKISELLAQIEQLKSGTDEITVLDGSMGSQLRIEGLPDDETYKKIWSSSALLKKEFHDKIVSVHVDNINAGASWITTCSYGCNPNYYSRMFDDNEILDKMAEHAKLSAQLAVKARAQAKSKNRTQILGCLPPIYESHRRDLFYAFLEQRGEEYLTNAFMVLARALQEGGADIFLIESMTCWEEANIALNALQRLYASSEELQIVVAFEGALRDMQRRPRPHDAAAIAWKVLEKKEATGLPIVGLGFNCAPPEVHVIHMYMEDHK